MLLSLKPTIQVEWSSQMECPKCFGEMDRVLEEGTNIERCRDCHGLYFDQLTQAMLEGIQGKVEIDTYSEQIDETYDAMVYVDCPKCDRIMDQRMIEEPNRIRFELCPTCNSAFLDAGEFKQYTGSDYLQDFLSLLPEA